MGKNISQGIGQIGLSASIVGGMSAGATQSAGQTPLVRSAIMLQVES